MKRYLTVIAAVLVFTLVFAGAALASGQPNFGDAIYADGQTWGTKGLADLPAPNGHNEQSFDMIFVFPGAAADGQLPVAEAAPGNPAYNGGRWNAQVVEWLIEPVLITSYAELQAHAMAGHLTYSSAGRYFECPLLPNSIGR